MFTITTPGKITHDACEGLSYVLLIELLQSHD